MSDNRVVADCRAFPSEKKCSLTVAGTEEEVLANALKIDPTRADCYIALSLVEDGRWESQRDLNKQIQVLEQATRLEPKWPYPRADLALKLIKAKSFDKAEALTSETIQIVEQLVPVVTTTPMEEFYETFITGRSESGFHEFRRLDLLQQIAKAKRDSV